MDRLEVVRLSQWKDTTSWEGRPNLISTNGLSKPLIIVKMSVSLRDAFMNFTEN